MTAIQLDKNRYDGILVIGDPHLESRIPGFRKDDYPRTVLNKLAWCLAYAGENRLVPVIAGDLFHLPRSNPNWLLVEIIRLFKSGVFGIWGNHDVHENSLSPDDSISVLVQSGALTLLDTDNVIVTEMKDQTVVIGGTPWMQKLPDRLDAEKLSGVKPHLALWVVHHDIRVPGYEEHGRINPRSVPGIDVVVNGHIHRSLEAVEKGGTLWLTPGNISRRTRSDITRHHTPGVLRIDVTPAAWRYTIVEVPHADFETVFHEAVADEDPVKAGSAFISGLAELQARKTQTGEGFTRFLEKNLAQFETEVAGEIKKLAKEITDNV